MTTSQIALAMCCAWTGLFTLISLLRSIALFLEFKELHQDRGSTFMLNMIFDTMMRAIISFILWLSLAIISFHAFFTYEP